MKSSCAKIGSIVVTAAVRKEDLIQVVNPATLERVRDVRVFRDDEIREAVDLCRDAQGEWAQRSVAERIEVLRKFRDALVDHKDEIAATIVSETGKPAHEAVAVEIFYSCNMIDYYTKIAAETLRPESRSSLNPLFKTKRLEVACIPYGVIGFITPWNFPFMFTCGDIVPALLAGNGVVIKPSEIAPLSGLLVERLAAEVFPRDLVRVVTGYGEAGASLTGCADYVSFTGSVVTGKKVMAKAAETLTPVSLELGGKDPLIVLSDADLHRTAAATTWGALFNAGQACISVERVYVEKSVASEFTKLVVKEVEKIRQGPDEHAPIDIGSMTSARQLSIVESHVDDAVRKGAHIEIGGRRNVRYQGYFYEPTVLTGVTHDMLIMTEETFGPVIPIMVVKDREEALAMANDSRYGLSAAIFTRDSRIARSMARQIRAGAVCINDCCVNYIIPELPFGGFKESGIGFRHSPGGLTKFCRQQAMLEDRIGLKREPVWFPYTEGKANLFKRLIPMLFRSGLRRKLLG